MTDKQLTPKEQLVIDQFEIMRVGYGELAKQRILSNYSGWREIISEMTEEEITLSNLQKPETYGHS